MRNQRFGDDARALVRTAQDRARVLGHPGLGSEHLLYAVARAPARLGDVAREHGLTPDGVATATDRLISSSRPLFDGIDTDALAVLGIDLAAVREAVEANFGPSRPSPHWTRRRRLRVPGHLPVTGRARSCLRAAVHEAGCHGATRVGADHLGAVVVATDGGLVPPILAALGVSAPTLRAAILDGAW